MMGNGNQSRFHEHETKRKEKGISTELSRASLHDRIDEETDDDDRDDDELYEHEFEFADSQRGSYGANGHSARLETRG